MTKKKVTSVALDLETDKEAEIIARSEGVTKSVIYRRAIKEYLERKRDEKIMESKKRLEKLEEKYT